MQPSDLEPPPYDPAPPPSWRSEQWWRFQRGARRPVRRTVTVTLVTFAVVAALGAPLGLLWRWLAPGVPVVDAGDNGIVVNDPSPEQYIAADGWFTLLGLAFGVLVAIAAWLVLRRDRGPFLLIGVVGGTFVAGHWVAPLIGEMIGRDAYEQWRTSAAQGASYLAPPEVHALGPTLVPAFAAAIVLTLLAGWSNDPDLDQPGAAPGYGPNHPPYDAYDVPIGPTGPHGVAEPYGAAGPQGLGGPHGAGPQGPHGVAGPYGAAGPHGPTGPERSVGAGGTGEVGQRDGDGADPRQQA
ncbi:hypothetical protein [Actinoplanes sp. NPDC023714]|uniref:hypothetical protein n=1 Tax=Actinoplanes sp. NPDC023714 TaxID=3154322 RepID=UPI0033F10EF0